MKIKINDNNGLILKTQNKVCKEDIEIIVDKNLGSGFNPTGTINITSNGIVDVTQYASANVNVQGLPQANDMLQTIVDNTKSCEYLLYRYSGNNVDFIANLDTSQANSGESMFEYCSDITSVPTFDSSNFTTIRYMFHNDKNLVSIKLNTDSATNYYSTFDSCYKLKLIDISTFYSYSTTVSNYAFRYCYSLMALVIRKLGINYIISNNTFYSCHHMLGTTNAAYNPDGLHDGYVYVPRAMIETLSNETNWATMQFRALEDYTIDGTTTGALNLAKMGVEV